MKPYTNYLFDLDGTLITTIDLICECFSFSLKKFLGLEVPRKEILVKIGLPLKKQFIAFIEEHHLNPNDFNLEEIAKMHMDHQLSIWKDYVSPYPNTQEVLKQLKEKNKNIAIVTSRMSNTATLYLEHTQLKPYCDVLITPESTERHKPSPEPVWEALKQLKGNNKETQDKAIMIGDSLFDIQAGNAANIDTAWIFYDDNPVLQKSKIKFQQTTTHPQYQELNSLATYTISNLKELII